MGLLDVAALDRILAAGCPGCAGTKLAFRTYVDARLPIAEGEPNGPITWVYKGELFLDGVFDVRCADCDTLIFHSDVCPRCHAEGALERILETHNRLAVPKSCPDCDIDDLRYFAMVPARVVYANGRGEKAQTHTELLDPGFHGLRAECVQCGTFLKTGDDCPLCGAHGPIRARPT